MASVFDKSGLTLAPKEVEAISKFIVEQVFESPELMRMHGVQTGVLMKEQIILASQFGKSGLKADGTCTRKASGAVSTLTQKYWDPAGIEDTLVHCNAELTTLFKAYFNSITRYREVYEIEGSELAELLVQLSEVAIKDTINRAVWFGDTAVTASGSAAAGLVSAANVKFYDYFDGLWKQIFAGVTATTIKRVTIAQNASAVTKAAQIDWSVTSAIDDVLAPMYAAADPRLRASKEAKFYLSGEIYADYIQELQSKGVYTSMDPLTGGIQTPYYNGKEVVNMDTIWDLDARQDFEKNSTDHLYYLPNRAVLTMPANIPVGTLNKDQLTEIEQWYEKKDRTNNFAYGFSLDSKVLEEYLIIVAY